MRHANKILRRVNAQLPGTKPKSAIYKYVVVGAGSAGCALASKLARDVTFSLRIRRDGNTEFA